MDAKSLRIGNWVQFNEDGKWTNQKVEYIGKDTEGYKGYFVHFGWASTTLEDHFNDGDFDVKPIELTPEILEACGLTKYDECRWVYPDPEGKTWVSGLEYDYEDDTWSIYINAWEYGIIHPKYLHELQNAIYALTGEELTVKL